jgi:hypothetical protein
MPKIIQLPHQFVPRTYQLEFLQAPQRFKVGVWNRRSGKSKTLLNEQIRKTQLVKGIYYYVLPTYRQAKQVIWDNLIAEHLPPEIVDKKNDSELAIYYKNGSIQRFVGSEDYDKHRGINAIDVVFDEYAEQHEEIWTAIFQPILRENGGTATFGFTPKGKNHAWQLVQKARDSKEWYISILGVKDTKTFTDEELEEIKRNTPQSLYQQEYEVSFIDSAGQYFRRIRENVYEADNPLVDPLVIEGNFQIGVDLAKYNDWTVITPFNLNTFRVYPQDRFNQIDWNLQRARIEIAYSKYMRRGNKLEDTGNVAVCIDATGVGDPIVEELKKVINIPELPFNHAFKFTQQSRSDLLKHLAILLEQDKIKIPNDEGLIAELESFRYEMSENGTLKVKVPDNMTDDRVMSLALAVYGQSTKTINYLEQERQWQHATQKKTQEKNLAR